MNIQGVQDAKGLFKHREHLGPKHAGSNMIMFANASRSCQRQSWQAVLKGMAACLLANSLINVRDELCTSVGMSCKLLLLLPCHTCVLPVPWELLTLDSSCTLLCCK